MRNKLIKILSSVFSFLFRNAFIKRGILFYKQNNVMPFKLIIFQLHKIGIFFIIYQISFHAKNEFYLSLGSIICFRKSLYNAMICNRYCLMSPFNCSVYKRFRSSYAIHFGKWGMKMKLNSFFLCVILFFGFKNGLNTVRSNHIFSGKAILLISASDNKGLRVCYFGSNGFNNILRIKNLYGYRRGVIRYIKG